MNTDQIIILFISPLFAIIGFFGRTLYEKRCEKHNRKVRQKLEEVEYKMNDFYYPIYVRLRRENSIWQKIIRIYQQNGDYRIINELDGELLNNHLHIQDIINKNIVKARPTPEMKDIIVEYDDHVTIYNIMRKIGIRDRFPKDFNAPYPTELMNMITKRLVELQAIQQKLDEELV